MGRSSNILGYSLETREMEENHLPGPPILTGELTLAGWE